MQFMARILIVDDSPSIHRLVSARLKAAGHEIVALGLDGNEALALFISHRPDMVLMDITMPNCDGKHGLKLIRERDPNAKVLMLSALSSPELIQECINIGAVGFISKDRLRESGYMESQVDRVLRGIEISIHEDSEKSKAA